MDSTDAATIKAGKEKSKAQSSSKSQKAGLEFLVGRVKRYLKAGKYADRISAGAPVYLVAVLECLIADVLEFAGKQTKHENQKRITPSHIKLAMEVDKELRELCGGVVIPNASAPPKIHADLLPKKS